MPMTRSEYPKVTTIFFLFMYVSMAPSRRYAYKELGIVSETVSCLMNRASSDGIVLAREHLYRSSSKYFQSTWITVQITYINVLIRCIIIIISHSQSPILYRVDLIYQQAKAELTSEQINDKEETRISLLFP